MDTQPQIDPNLQAVIDAWASLPASIRLGILSMLNAAKTSEGGAG